MPPIVTVITLNWNGWESTIKCLESVSRLEYPEYRVIVVDNGSEDGSAGHIKGWADGKPGVAVIESKENLGFTGGCNLGAAYALRHGAEYLFLLNNDAVVLPDTLDQLIKVALETDAAIVGARVFDESGERLLFAGSSWPARLFGLRRLPPMEQAGRSWPSSDATGAAILVRGDLLQRRIDECGYFLDDRLFMYGEETDFCIYAKTRGYKCIIARDAVVLHKEAEISGGKGNPRSYYYITRNRIYLANRWLGLPVKVLFHLYYAPSRLIIQLTRILLMRQHALKAVASGLMDGYTGVTGKWDRH